MELRPTFADTSKLEYRLRAASALLGVTDNTLRGYADNAGIAIRRASEITPGAPAVRVFTPDNLFRLARWRREMGYIRTPHASSPVVITVDVIKGGTGKTTTSVELAIHLQLSGLRVLLIDLDISANSTQLMGYEPDLTIDEAAGYEVSADAIVTDTFATLLLPFLERARGGGLSLRQTTNGGTIIKRPFGDFGPHLIAADTFLGDIEQALANAKGHRELYIRQLIATAVEGGVPAFPAHDYDVIIFDCPPNVSFTSTAALAAADLVVAPIRLDAFSVKGLTKLMNEITLLGQTYNEVTPDLVILPTHYAPRIDRIGRMQSRLNTYREHLAPNVISASEEFPKSLDSYTPLSLQKPTSNASKEYKLFAEHILSKIAARVSAEQKGRKVA